MCIFEPQWIATHNAVKLLDQTLEEESNTDEALTELADASANEIARAA